MSQSYCSYRKLNISIFNALITQFFIKIYYLKLLKSAPVTLVNTPSVPICKHPFIRGKGCLHIGTEGVFSLFLRVLLTSALRV
jgi:hypothetical protein